jgi:hypothetical protein
MRTILCFLLGCIVLKAPLKSTPEIRLPSMTTKFTSPKVLTSTDFERILDCLAAVQSGFNKTKVGKRGERSMYQLKYITWTQWSEAPFEQATTNPKLAHLVALCHLKWLAKHIQHGSEQYRIIQLSVAWDAGLTGYRSCKTNFDQVQRAHRVLNLYNDLTFSQNTLCQTSSSPVKVK